MALTPFPVTVDGESLAFGAAVPDGKGPFPAVVLLPAIAGVNAYIERTAERLRGLGCFVAVVDYYAREGAAPDVSTPEKIGAAVAGLSDPLVLREVGATVEALRTRDDVLPDAIATFGFCIGGLYAYLSACEHDGIAAAVDYYGTLVYGTTTANKPVSPLDRAAELKAPLLAHFGDFDRLISAVDIAAFGEALRTHQKHHEIFVYGGAPHAFDEDFRPPVFRPAAAQEAWRRSVAFLDWHLRRVAPR